MTPDDRTTHPLHEPSGPSAERYRTLLQINNAIITSLTQDALLAAICQALRPVIAFDGAAISLYQPDRDTFRFLAIEAPRTSEHFRVGVEFTRQESISAWVFDQQRPRARGDLEIEQEYSNDRRVVAEGIRSDCLVPLIVAGKSIGTLAFGSFERHRYSDSDVEFLCEVANQVALAVSNMNAYEQIAELKLNVERTAERYRTLLDINNTIITRLPRSALLHSVAEALRRVIPFDRAAVTLHIPARDVLQYIAMEGSLPPSTRFRQGLEIRTGESMSAWVFEHQQAVVRRDLEAEQQFPNDRHLVADGIMADCLVPLVVGQRSVGTLDVGSKTKGQYSDDDLRFLQEVGNQVALAVANMQAYEEIDSLRGRLEKENVYLQEEIRTEHNFQEIVGNHPALLGVLAQVDQVAATDATVLILGETGTGKESIARAIHDRSPRSQRPLVKVNCSAISAGLVESELFGHVKGAFTGAMERRVGRFELASGGTIFLDEVGELPLDTQVKLLRVLQEQEFEPVGSSRTVSVDVRVIAATNRDLEAFVRQGGFRADLFYRLNVFPLRMPPLRDRRSDIPALALTFLGRYAKSVGKTITGISRNAMDRLMNYPWPGNVRELQNVIERAVILCRGGVLELQPDLLPVLPPDGEGVPSEMPADAGGPDGRSSPRGLATLEEVERDHILAALKVSGGVVEGTRGAAKLLDLHPNTLRNRMDKLGIKRRGSQGSPRN